MTLTGKQNRYLRALGHHLKPSLQLGKAGLSDEFIGKIKELLERHELIKVKLLQSCPLNLVAASEGVSAALHCDVAQQIGKTMLLYQARAEDPKITLPL